MSSWIPGRQTTLGLAVLGIGTSFSFLFFYSPRPNVSPSFDARSLDLHPRLGFSESPSLEGTELVPVVPSGTRWMVRRDESISDSRDALQNSSRTVSVPTKPYAQSLDQLLLQAPQVEQIPKSYPAPAQKLSGPTVRPASETSSRSIDDMVPLATPRSSINSPPLSDGTSRLGAGKYRPNIPSPTQLSPWQSSMPPAPLAPSQVIQHSFQPLNQNFTSANTASPTPQPYPQTPSTGLNSAASDSLMGHEGSLEVPRAPQLVNTGSVPLPSTAPPNLQAPQGASKDIFSRYEEKREPKFIRQPRSYR